MIHKDITYPRANGKALALNRSLDHVPLKASRDIRRVF